jgi:glycosyltransferase involved in cell wall biosynthesis
MWNPRVSVLMAVYNARPYLDLALDSIRSQTLADFEVVAVDDGSTDGSDRILSDYRARDARLRIVSQPNAGLIAALNRGLEHCRAEYIARMDADDVALPERLERQVQFLDEHPDHVAVGCRTLLIDADGEPICPYAQLLEHAAIDAMHMAGGGGAICHPAVMIRAKELRGIGGYDPAMRHAEDLDLFLRLAEVGRVANLPDVLLRYRMHAKSVGHRNRLEQHRSTLAAVQAAHRRRGLEPPLLPDHPPSPGGSLHHKWAWWALAAGYPRTARKHALRALRAAPHLPTSWKLLLCALRGR